jgi:TRAP transporter 4TM/12TM fusion protein
VQSRSFTVVTVLYFLLAFGFFAHLLNYYVLTAGGPTLLAFTLVPVTFVLFALNELRTGGMYPRLGFKVNCAITAAYAVLCAVISVYMVREYEAIGTVRAGFWNTTDMVLGSAMFLLVMEYARIRYFELFLLNIVLVLYAVYGWMVPGMFNHPGLSWERILTMMSLETTTGVYSSLPQLALTLIGSFVLVLSVLRAFGCIDSILRGTSHITAYSPYALPQTAVVGSLCVAAVSGSGAANAVTTGSATIPALIKAGMSPEDAASVETASSLGGQLMPPIMGISAFLMADFLGRSYFDVVARGYAPALIYFIGVAAGVYLISVRYGSIRSAGKPETLNWSDWINLMAFASVVGGLILLMALLHLPPIFAALYTFVGVGLLMLVRTLAEARATSGVARLQAVGRPLLRFLDSFAQMTGELTLLLATLGVLTSAFINTGVPTKVGFILVDAAGVNLVVMALVAFAFGALLGMGLPPAPTYILTALVIAPHMIKAGLDPWPVHFFAFFLAVWGELTPPTSVVAAVTSKIANASFLGTLWRGIILCSSLFVLMAAVLVRPELVLEPGLAQLGTMALVTVATLGVTFTWQARFSDRRELDVGIRVTLGAFAMVVLLHPNIVVATLACVPVLGLIGYWFLHRRQVEQEAALQPSQG